MFGCEPAAQHIIACGHDFDTNALEIGVQDASLNVDCFAPLHRYVVHQQRSEATRVFGECLSDALKIAAFPLVALGSGRCGCG